MDQPQQLGHPRMRQGAAGEGFNRDSRVLERPRFAEGINNRTRVVSTAVGVEEAALRFENLWRARPSKRGKIGRDHSALGCVTGLEWFHHGAKVFPQAGSMAGGNRQSAHSLFDIEA